MRCRICGAQLKKDGDICKNCYGKYRDKIELSKENEEEVFSIKRKYSPKFNLLKNGEVLFLLIIIILSGFATYNTFIAILITILCLVLFGGWMFYNKKRAQGTKITFYETKFKYKAKYPLVDKEEAFSYDDVKDIAYFQSKSQKLCKIGDVRIYTKGFLNGITIHDVPNIIENFNKMKEIITSAQN